MRSMLDTLKEDIELRAQKYWLQQVMVQNLGSELLKSFQRGFKQGSEHSSITIAGKLLRQGWAPKRVASLVSLPEDDIIEISKINFCADLILFLKRPRILKTLV